MSIETRAQRHQMRSRRRLVVIAALAAFVLVAVGGVAIWSRDSWREQAISSDVFPDVSGDGWADSTSDGWDSSGLSATSPGTAITGSAAVTSGTPSAVPTVRAPRAAAATGPAPVPATSTTTPSPSPTTSVPRGKRKPKPTPPSKPAPSVSDCLLVVVC